jgi:hypothetical protein
MDVIDMGGKVVIISNRVLLITALPNPTFTPMDHNR